MDAVGKAWLHISRLDRQNHGYTIRYRGNGRFGVAAYLPNGAYLPKWTFADSTFLAERLLNVSKGQVTNFHVQADLTEKKFIRVLDAGGVPVRSFYYSFSNESRAFLSFTSFKDGKFPDVQYGALKIVPRSITRDLVVATSELKATWVKMDPQEGFVRVQLRDLWSAQRHRGIDYRAMVRIDTDGFLITEGTRVEIYSEEHRGLRAELTFEKGKFPLHQYDMSNFPIREPTEITLVLRAHPKWGFKEQAISDAASATLSVKSKEIVLKLNQGQVVPQPRDGKYFVRAFFEGRPINLRWLGLSAEGKTCGADAYYKTVKGFEFYLRDSLFKEGSSRVKHVKPGHTELHIDGWSPTPLSASILSRYSNLKVRSRWFEIPAEEGRAPLFPAMRGDAGRQHLTLLGTAMGTELKLYSGWIGPNEVLNLDYNPTPVIYPEVADNWMLVAATSGERVYRDDTLRPGTYAWVYERYEREVYRSPEFNVPDQSAFFRLPKPDLPASALAGRVRFRIDADTLKSWIRDEVRVALVRENTARHLLGPFLSSSSDGRGFANMRMVGDEIEVYGLPTDGSLCLFFYSYDTDSASEEVEVEFDANKEMYGGGAPPLRRYMRPSSFPYVPSDKQETLRKLYEYDKSIVFELHTKGKRVQFERNLFLGQEYELHLFRKDAAEDATPLVIKFTPRLKDDSHGVEMGWEANAITKVQPLLKGLPSNFSLRDD
ncbi:MAG: hypothetical protein KDB07_03310, partial [Planctomycetes bacterium]|nr:hypothetical protein [Planctomycetota bacterium]